jgi:TatD DNase family protein
MPLINLHTHHPTFQHDILEIENVYFGQEKKQGSRYQSVGLHPWYVEGIDGKEAGKWLLGEVEKPQTVAVGEAGLDKVIATPLAEQRQAFQVCIDVAKAQGLPLIVHCVRAYEEVLKMTTTDMRSGALTAVVLHGFNKNAATAQMLLRAGCFLSFGAALLHSGSPAVESLRQTPVERLFLETDVASEVGIETVYEQAAMLKGMTVSALREQIFENYTRHFKKVISL